MSKEEKVFKKKGRKERKKESVRKEENNFEKKMTSEPNAAPRSCTF
jgi:hypothetical protein